MLSRFLLLLVTLVTLAAADSADETARKNLVEAITSEDFDRQSELIRGFVTSSDSHVHQTLSAWRGGMVYILETNNTKIPIILEAETDNEGKAAAVLVSNGAPLSADGKRIRFSSNDLTPADTTSKLRKALKATLDLLALNNPNPKMRRDAVIKLGQEQNADYVPFFRDSATREKDKEVVRALKEAIAVTQILSTDPAEKVEAITQLGKLRSINYISFLTQLQTEARTAPDKLDDQTMEALRSSIVAIETYQWWGNFFGTAFRGLSLAAVLLVAALGLAITFGLMGVINMAHGEIIMIGAYTTYVTQNIFKSWAGTNQALVDYYFLPAILFSFLVAGGVGLILERGIIRFLYKRPLESLLATWGVSLVLQQLFRSLFGAANVQVNSPGWLSGSLVISDVLLGNNRMFIIAFAIFIVLMTYLLLTRTSLGLQIRAVMQNRRMASALGVRTERVNMMTFAFGSGLAGMAGACLAQIGNVNPGLGQNYIVDCFMVVVLGGVGNLVGTVSASMGIGVTDQLLQPWLGAVLGKITVLSAIILFLQWRPAGLFVTRSRTLEG
ncbi:MAG: urea ABC transporter permease subunit UrtB [Verrucomicrobiota bacterium]|nr:urea ABC transporter permease subunit UrtB [Verrucomicrobiota bacterium]